MTSGEHNYTYLLRCSDGSLYCGWTNDLEKRLASHNAGTAANTPERAVRSSWSITRNTRPSRRRCSVSTASSVSPVWKS